MTISIALYLNPSYFILNYWNAPHALQNIQGFMWDEDRVNTELKTYTIFEWELLLLELAALLEQHFSEVGKPEDTKNTFVKAWKYFLYFTSTATRN